MRIKTEITDLTPEQWEQVQKNLKTSYDIPDNAYRVCLVLTHGWEERHVETPVSALTSLLLGLAIGNTSRQLSDTLNRVLAMAVLTPDDDRLPSVNDDGEIPDDLSHEEQYQGNDT